MMSSNARDRAKLNETGLMSRFLFVPCSPLCVPTMSHADVENLEKNLTRSTLSQVARVARVLFDKSLSYQATREFVKSSHVYIFSTWDTWDTWDNIEKYSKLFVPGSFVKFNLTCVTWDKAIDFFSHILRTPKPCPTNPT